MKKRYSVTVNVFASEQEMTGFIDNLQTLVKNVSPKDLALLAKAVQNPLLKSAALNELKKRV